MELIIIIYGFMQIYGPEHAIDCHNGNEMRNATCADAQISIEWPYCSFPILWCCVKRLTLMNTKLSLSSVAQTCFQENDLTACLYKT